MLSFQLKQAKGGRVMLVKTKELQRYHVEDKNGLLQWAHKDGVSLAITHGTIKVYKLPTAQAFHKEYMLQNARTMYHSNSSADDSLVVLGLRELEFKI